MNDVNICSQASMTPLWTLIGTRKEETKNEEEKKPVNEENLL